MVREADYSAIFAESDFSKIKITAYLSLNKTQSFIIPNKNKSQSTNFKTNINMRTPQKAASINVPNKLRNRSFVTDYITKLCTYDIYTQTQ